MTTSAVRLPGSRLFLGNIRQVSNLLKKNNQLNINISTAASQGHNTSALKRNQRVLHRELNKVMNTMKERYGTTSQQIYNNYDRYITRYIPKLNLGMLRASDVRELYKTVINKNLQAYKRKVFPIIFGIVGRTQWTPAQAQQYIHRILQRYHVYVHRGLVKVQQAAHKGFVRRQIQRLEPLVSEFKLRSAVPRATTPGNTRPPFQPLESVLPSNIRSAPVYLASQGYRIVSPFKKKRRLQ